jgi:hypothetical protein
MGKTVKSRSSDQSNHSEKSNNMLDRIKQSVGLISRDGTEWAKKYFQDFPNKFVESSDHVISMILTISLMGCLIGITGSVINHMVYFVVPAIRSFLLIFSDESENCNRNMLKRKNHMTNELIKISKQKTLFVSIVFFALLPFIEIIFKFLQMTPVIGFVFYILTKLLYISAILIQYPYESIDTVLCYMSYQYSAEEIFNKLLVKLYNIFIKFFGNNKIIAYNSLNNLIDVYDLTGYFNAKYQEEFEQTLLIFGCSEESIGILSQFDKNQINDLIDVIGLNMNNIFWNILFSKSSQNNSMMIDHEIDRIRHKV